MKATETENQAAQEAKSILLPPPETEEGEEMRNPNLALYRAYGEIFDILGTEEAGRVFKNMIKYARGKAVPENLSRLGQAFLEVVKIIIDKDDLIWLYKQQEEHRKQQEEGKAAEHGGKV